LLPPPTQHHSFFRNFHPLLNTCSLVISNSEIWVSLPRLLWIVVVVVFIIVVVVVLDLTTRLAQ